MRALRCPAYCCLPGLRVARLRVPLYR